MLEDTEQYFQSFEGIMILNLQFPNKLNDQLTIYIIGSHEIQPKVDGPRYTNLDII